MYCTSTISRTFLKLLFFIGITTSFSLLSISSPSSSISSTPSGPPPALPLLSLPLLPLSILLSGVISSEPAITSL
ncbi:hypothetical protein BDZ91DRAFT_717365, partial [Kalaharituber pfeilii]